jgi:hypothetical protein
MQTEIVLKLPPPNPPSFSLTGVALPITMESNTNIFQKINIINPFHTNLSPTFSQFILVCRENDFNVSIYSEE